MWGCVCRRGLTEFSCLCYAGLWCRMISQHIEKKSLICSSVIKVQCFRLQWFSYDIESWVNNKEGCNNYCAVLQYLAGTVWLKHHSWLVLFSVVIVCSSHDLMVSSGCCGFFLQPRQVKIMQTSQLVTHSCKRESASLNHTSQWHTIKAVNTILYISKRTINHIQYNEKKDYLSNVKK